MSQPGDREARQDITEVLVRYASAVDGRDWDLLRSCFTSDCRAEYGGLGAWQGVDALIAFMVDAHARMGPSLHRISNAAITVTGDRASARTHVDMVGMSPDGASGVTSIGRYDDELVRMDGGWRITRRRFTPIRFAPWRADTARCARSHNWTTFKTGVQ
jgi:3-phenylpropionate/cinnamic acid dioxygenase small subunit